MTKISILMPVYNAARFLDSAISSVLAQSYDQFELLIYDDGSDDDSLEVVKRNASRDSRIKYFVGEKNNGVVFSRNFLINKASGDYICWIDADDFIDRDKLRNQIRFLRENTDVVAVGTGCVYVTEDGHELSRELFPADPGRQAHDPYLCCASIMVTRQAAIGAGPFDPIFVAGGEDGDWILRLAESGLVTNIPYYGYYYRRGHGSLSRGAQSQIRRLGVVAREATRIRRGGEACPIRSGEFAAAPNFLSDEWFLAQARFGSEGIVTALSLPLECAPPLVTVVIPYLDTPDFISKSVDSLFQGDFKNIEVVIVDDGSLVPLTFESMNLASEVRNRVVIIHHNQNSGPSGARNTALEKARGKFIVFQDADDLASAGRVPVLLRYLLENPDVVAVGSAIRFIDEVGSTIRHQSFPKVAVSDSGFHGCCASFMVRFNDAVRNVRFDPQLKESSEDVDFLLRLTEIGALRNVNEFLYDYRLRSQSLTSRPAWQSSHANYMLRRAFNAYGLRRIEDLPNLLKSIDGSQTGELVLTAMWRAHRALPARVLSLISIAGFLPVTLHRALIKSLRIKISPLKNKLFRFLAAIILHIQAYSRSLKITPWIRNVIYSVQSIARRRSKKIRVGVIDNWGDAAEAMDMLLPARSREFAGVSFEVYRNSVFRAYDYYLILNTPTRSVRLRSVPEQIVFAIGEPPTPHHAALYAPVVEGCAVLAPTFQSNPPVKPGGTKNVIGPVFTRTWSIDYSFDELVAMEAPVKTKGLSWVTSNLALLDGHRQRLAFLERIRGKVDFDLYGRGFDEIRDKSTALLPYRYTIAYENGKYPNYFTEKLMDALLCFCVPIYVGAPNISDFFPDGSYIAIDERDENVIERINNIVRTDDWFVRLDAIKEARRRILSDYNVFIRFARYFSRRGIPLVKKSAAITVDPVMVKFD